jgi:MFS family permease
MRAVLGIVGSPLLPCTYSLIQDYFPPSYRSTANSIESAGTYFGTGIVSISVILIQHYGWRVMYQYLGFAAITMGLLFLVLIREPPRGVYEKKAVI